MNRILENRNGMYKVFKKLYKAKKYDNRKNIMRNEKQKQNTYKQ